jgi:hypothetical protein
MGRQAELLEALGQHFEHSLRVVCLLADCDYASGRPFLQFGEAIPDR